MARIIQETAKRISKYGNGFVEGDTVLGQIGGGLALIPFEGQGHRPNLGRSLGIRITL